MALFGASLSLVACARGEPPTADAGGASPSVAPLPASFAMLPKAAPEKADGATSTPSASAVLSSSSMAATPNPTPAPAETEPGKLPQTDDKPQPTGPVFEAHVKLLWDAIVNDTPDAALPFFFPEAAYAQVKDIPHPENDWKRRLVGAFQRDVHALHARLGDNAANAKFSRIDVPMRHAKWVKPREELNKGSYWRVFGTRVFYEDDGRERFFEILSMISWRGEWYVVHLRDFK